MASPDPPLTSMLSKNQFATGFWGGKKLCCCVCQKERSKHMCGRYWWFCWHFPAFNFLFKVCWNLLKRGEISSGAQFAKNRFDDSADDVQIWPCHEFNSFLSWRSLNWSRTKKSQLRIWHLCQFVFLYNHLIQPRNQKEFLWMRLRMLKRRRVEWWWFMISLTLNNSKQQ